MHVPLQHIIGTVALISLVITATLAYSMVSTSVTTDLQKRQLQQIAERTALEIVELVNVAKFSIYNYEPITKAINLPVDVAGSTYTITLVDESSEGKGYLVKASLVSNGYITAESPLPLNYTGTSRITFNGETQVKQLQSGLDNTTVNYSNVIYGKPSSIIWAQAKWDSPNNATITAIEVGLGWT